MPPAPEHQNGPLHSYSIFYQGNQFDRAMREIVYELTDQSYPDTTTRDFYLNELMEYEQYTVMVRVSTNAGYSEYTAAIHARTTEAGNDRIIRILYIYCKQRKQVPSDMIISFLQIRTNKQTNKNKYTQQQTLIITITISL